MENQNKGMLAQVRQQAIADLVNQKGNITVNDLCDIFGVSPATIRNDLSSLEERFLIKRTHGGAISCNKTVYELNTSQKAVQNAERKRAIAEEALKLIQEGDAIAIDSGTTTFELARLLTGFSDLTVLTNDLRIAVWLEQNTKVNIMMVGGSVRKGFSCTVGQAALDMLSALHVDKAFIAANGVCAKTGLSTPSMEMASVKKQIINTSDQVILLADSSKIERTAFATFASLSILDMIITDESADISFVEAAKSKGVSVLLAPVDQ